MKMPQQHIQIENYINIKKIYLDEVVLPIFREVSSVGVPIVKYYQIANKNISIQFYGEGLLGRLSLAIEHNEINIADVTNAIDITMYVWDGLVGNQFVAPWSSDKYIFKKEANTQHVVNDGFMGIFAPGEETLMLYDVKNKKAYFWTRNPQALPGWVIAAPMRTLLHWFLSESNVYLLHGASVGVGDKAVLLAAKGGSGKSTTALACFSLAMNYLGDDYVAVGLADEITVYSLYNSMKVIIKNDSPFEYVKKHLWGQDRGKSILFLLPLSPKQIKKSALLKAIFIPIIANSSKTAIVPVSKAEAMIALAPTTLFQLPLAQINTLENLKKIIMRTPCYFLQMSQDSREVAKVIETFLQT